MTAPAVPAGVDLAGALAALEAQFAELRALVISRYTAEATGADAGKDDPGAILAPSLTASPGWITRARSERGWSVLGLVTRMAQVAGRDGVTLPDPESMVRMVRQWNSGQRCPSPLYAEILRRLFSLPRSEQCQSPSDLRALSRCARRRRG